MLSYITSFVLVCMITGQSWRDSALTWKKHCLTGITINMHVLDINGCFFSDIIGVYIVRRQVRDQSDFALNPFCLFRDQLRTFAGAPVVSNCFYLLGGGGGLD